jgi:hypothetical protein
MEMDFCVVFCAVELNNHVDNLSTSWEQAVLRTHPVDKLLEQHYYMSAAGFVTTCAFLRMYYTRVYYTRKNAQVVTNLFTSCRQVVFALLVPSCCNKFGTSW